MKGWTATPWQSWHQRLLSCFTRRAEVQGQLEHIIYFGPDRHDQLAVWAGNDSLYAGARFQRYWASKAAYRSPRYLTSWHELPKAVVQAK